MRVKEYNSLSDRFGTQPQYRGAVISIHGMTSHGAWQREIGLALQDASIRHIAVNHGFRLGSVIVPATATRVAKKILAAFQEHVRYGTERSEPSCLTPGALGHSYGTVAIGRALKIFPDLHLKRIILFGSILSPTYPWDEMHANGQVEAVLHEKSASDFWAGVTRLPLIPDSGPSGIEGFEQGKAFIIEREYPYTGHCGLSHDLHCRQKWIPFLRGE